MKLSKGWVAAVFVMAAAAPACRSIPPYPGYGQTVEEWDPIPKGKGRVVFYSRSGGSRKHPEQALKVVFDGKNEVIVPGGIFAFADLKAGPHFLHYGHLRSESQKILDTVNQTTATTTAERSDLLRDVMNQNHRRGTGALAFEVPVGEILFVQVVRDGDPVLVDRPNAMKVLAGMQHKYRGALAFND